MELCAQITSGVVTYPPAQITTDMVTNPSAEITLDTVTDPSAQITRHTVADPSAQLEPSTSATVTYPSSQITSDTVTDPLAQITSDTVTDNSSQITRDTATDPSAEITSDTVTDPSAFLQTSGTDIVGLRNTLTEGESNFLRFCHLVLKVAPQAVRCRFDQEFPPDQLNAIIQRNMTLLMEMKDKRILTKAQWKLILPYGANVTSTNFDVTLMVCLFRNLSSIAPRYCDYDMLPPPSDESLGADLARIKYYRNYIAHCLEKNRKLDNFEFLICWETVSKAVSRIGGPMYELECSNLLVCSLDQSYMDVYRNFQMEKAELTEKLEMQEKKLQVLSEKLEDLELQLKDPLPSHVRDAIAIGNSINIHNEIDIKDYLMSETGAKPVEQDVLKLGQTLPDFVRLGETLPDYRRSSFFYTYKKNIPLDGTSDENLLRMCGTITEFNVTRQRSNSMCAVYTASLEHEEKEWFYKLRIRCDETYELHVINDYRLQVKYETLKSETQQTEHTTFRVKKGCQGTKSIEEFEMIYKQMQKPQFRLEDCIKAERSLLFRLMLARTTPSIPIVDNLKIAMKNQLPNISMAICWYIVRHYVAQSQVKNVLRMVVDIWPGYFCKCRDKGHSSICSKEPVIVVEAERHLDTLPEEYLGIQVVQSVSFRERQMEAHESAETEHISKISRNLQKVQTLPCDIVEKLFLKHTKLTMTYISLENPEYVQLCCQVKGIIPMGEDHFPAHLDHLKTHVNEGHVMFLEKLFVGQKIGTEPTLASYGTLGGFVEYRGKPALLTCAHVVYDKETLLGGSKRNKHKTEIETFCRLENDTSVACGYVVHDAFEYDNRDKTSVDAAVIRLNRDILVDSGEICKDNTSATKPVSHLGLKSPFLNDNYITHRVIKGIMTARSVGGTSGHFEGQITYEDYDADDETFIKFNYEHGVVPQWENFETQIERIKAENPKPMYTPSDVHFQKVVMPALGKAIQHKRYFVRFYNQLLLNNFTFQPGDSGACIYVVDDKTTVRSDCQANPTGCLGMAIASYLDVRDGELKCIVTPMKAILKELGLV